MSFKDKNINSEFSNYNNLLSNKTILYIYAKDKELANLQLKKVKAICKANNIKTTNVYFDINNTNSLKYKNNFKKIVNENKNVNILILDIKELTRDTFELYELKKSCLKNNINIYDLTYKKFVFDEIFDAISLERGAKVLNNKLDVLFIEPNKLPITKTIDNTLEDMQKLVGGYIEYTYLNGCDDVAIVCNEEAKLLRLPFNRYIGHDIIAGNFFVVGISLTNDDTCSLTKEQIDKYTKYFGKKSIEITNDKINEILKNSYKDYEL